MRKLLELIEKLYGKTALSKTLGTRTNVITLSDNETKRFIKDELNIEAASDAAALAAKNRAEKLIADIPKMNDQEILTFTNNLQRLDNKLNPPKAEMFDITTKKPISKEGIEQLETDFGLPEGVDEGSILGNLTRATQRLREQAKNVPGIQQGEKLQTGVMRSAVRYKMLDDLEKGILKVSEEEAAIIKGESTGDPIDLWLDNYGPDAMEAMQEMSPQLMRATTPKDMLLTIEKNLDARPLSETEKLEMKANTREAGRVMQDVKEGKVKNLTEEDPEEFSKGGRVGYSEGTPEMGMIDPKKVKQAQTMIKMGADVSTISSITGLSEAQVNQVQQSMGKAKGGRVGLKGGGDVPIITLDDKIDEMISFYQDYLKKGGKMDFLTFSRKYIPENFAKGGRVGYQDGGPTKDEYGIMSLPSVPSNPNSVNDDIDRVAQLVAQSYKMSPEAQMNNKQIAYDRIEEIAEQISYGGNIDGVRSNLMDYFNDKVQEYQSMIQEFSTGGRVGFAGGGAKKGAEGIESLIEMINKKFGKGTIKTADEMERPESAKVKQMMDDFMERNPDPNKQMTDEEIAQFLDDYGVDLTEEYITDFDGTLRDAMRILKEQKDYEAAMYRDYQAGRLDPQPGEKGRKEFLEKKMEEMEMSGESQLMTRDEIEELVGYEQEEKLLKEVGVNKPMKNELDEMKAIAPKMAERFELKQKYPGIDDNLITFIVDDPDPQRKAEVLATLDQAFELMRRGKSPDEILSILKNITDRTKQASGGLSYLSGF